MLRKLFLAAVLAAALPLAAQGKDLLPNFADLAEKQGPAVVNVSTSQTVHAQSLPPGSEDDPFNDFFRRFGPQPPPRDYESRSLGSGFILSQDGYILTNAHVVEAADDITVRLTDKREFKAKVVGADRRTDVAVLKIEATGLPVVTVGDPNKLRVGEWVVAIGSPFGFDNSVTAGIVSAKGRSVPQEANFVPFIQTDVAINPGNSGGPLFNLAGEVVGINSMIFSRTGGFMGLSFAIPIDVAIDVAKQLQATGRVSRGKIGVLIQEVTKELAESFALPKPTGALVSSVEKGSPAEKAGIQPSDVILKFDNREISTSNELPRIVAATKPGSKVNLQVWRKGEKKDLQIMVGETPDERVARRQPAGKKSSGETLAKLGLSVVELTSDQKNELSVTNGVLVENAEGPAQKAGIRRGDVIQAVNNQDVKSVEELNRLLSPVDRSRTVAVLIKRGEGSVYIPLKLATN
jgi:serine protease Do